FARRVVREQAAVSQPEIGRTRILVRLDMTVAREDRLAPELLALLGEHHVAHGAGVRLELVDEQNDAAEPRIEDTRAQGSRKPRARHVVRGLLDAAIGPGTSPHAEHETDDRHDDAECDQRLCQLAQLEPGGAHREQLAIASEPREHDHDRQQRSHRKRHLEVGRDDESGEQADEPGRDAACEYEVDEFDEPEHEQHGDRQAHRGDEGPAYFAQQVTVESAGHRLSVTWTFTRSFTWTFTRSFTWTFTQSFTWAFTRSFTQSFTVIFSYTDWPSLLWPNSSM